MQHFLEEENNINFLMQSSSAPSFYQFILNQELVLKLVELKDLLEWVLQKQRGKKSSLKDKGMPPSRETKWAGSLKITSLLYSSHFLLIWTY